MRNRCAGLWFLLFFSSLMAVSAETLTTISDDAALRRELSYGWFKAPPNVVVQKKSQKRQLEDGTPVEVRVEQGKTEFMVVIAREQGGAYPVSAPGGWALYRRYTDGKATRIRIFPSDDPYCYIQLRPDDNGRALLDSVVYGGYVYRSVVLHYQFEKVITESLSAILAAAGTGFPHQYFEPEKQNYAPARALSGAIRANLSGLTYVDDGAFDEKGQAVFILNGTLQKDTEGVNCSGFVKWLIDGLLKPLGKGPLAIGPLKTPRVARGTSFSEPFENEYDPFFGLDWNRNLASAAGRALRGERAADISEYEVDTTPIISLRIAGGDGSSSRAYPGYLQDCGFPIDGLKAVLYALAIDDPFSFYLAAVNTDLNAASKLRQYFHVSAFIPQFDENGVFKIVTFESAAETDFDAFVARYPKHLVHLVRIPLSGAFEPRLPQLSPAVVDKPTGRH